MAGRPEVTGFYHEDTFSIAYVVADPATRRAAIIDPVLDFDERAARISTGFADRILDFVRTKGCRSTGSSTRIRMPTISPPRAI